ncbi:hypothetical protein ES708_09138 [subsurface metagenome]
MAIGAFVFVGLTAYLIQTHKMDKVKAFLVSFLIFIVLIYVIGLVS